MSSEANSDNSNEPNNTNKSGDNVPVALLEENTKPNSEENDPDSVSKGDSDAESDSSKKNDDDEDGEEEEEEEEDEEDWEKEGKSVKNKQEDNLEEIQEDTEKLMCDINYGTILSYFERFGSYLAHREMIFFKNFEQAVANRRTLNRRFMEFHINLLKNLNSCRHVKRDKWEHYLAKVRIIF